MVIADNAERAGPGLWDILYAEDATPIRTASDLALRRMLRCSLHCARKKSL
ncbi:hypothetical protein ACEUZ9_005426 [Paracoccus litorisediminis]|jgi:hypothetical protein|uniref:hypothetical protein n=1 Tax=Paracoccus litorisediminis TaxID=2006130 RepID=UPI001FE9D831|nr:hypothetical protein [Paracoccus litorisediminis]